jgi:hypothetical protein
VTRTIAAVRLPMAGMAESRGSEVRRTARTGADNGYLSQPQNVAHPGRTRTHPYRVCQSVRVTMTESLFDCSFIASRVEQSRNDRSNDRPGKGGHASGLRVLPRVGAEGVRRAPTNPARNHFQQGFRHHG